MYSLKFKTNQQNSASAFLNRDIHVNVWGSPTGSSLEDTWTEDSYQQDFVLLEKQLNLTKLFWQQKV